MLQCTMHNVIIDMTMDMMMCVYVLVTTCIAPAWTVCVYVSTSCNDCQ